MAPRVSPDPSEIFQITNAVPFRNATMITGHWVNLGKGVSPGDIFEARKNGHRIGLIRLIGVVHVAYSRSLEDPPVELSMGYDGDYRNLLGATIHKIGPVGGSNPAQ